MRTKKRCTAEQFASAIRGRQFTPERLAAARRVLVDGATVREAAEESGRTEASVRQAVQLIFNVVAAQFATANPERAPRPGFVILTVEVPELACSGMLAGVSAAGGIVLEERRNG